MRFSKKSINLICITAFLALISGLLWVVCVEKNSSNPEDNEHSINYDSAIVLTDADQDIDDSNAKMIDLNQYAEECLINEGGTYHLSGTLAGQLRVVAQDQVVHLIFDNVSINSELSSAINVVSAGKVVITLTENTTNTILDSGKYSAGSDEDACIYSVCDLTINGAGVLNVSGYYEDAIHTKDVLKIIGGQIFVQAKRDGLHGNDGILIQDASLTVQSERSGLHSTKTGKLPKGNIEISGGEYSIIAGKYAISCSSDLSIAECRMYAIGVHDAFKVGGNTYIAEGVLKDE